MTFNVNVKSPQADNELSTRTKKMHPILGLLYKIISVVSVTLIISSAIGIGQYQPLSGILGVCLDFAYRYLVFKHELWIDACDFF